MFAAYSKYRALHELMALLEVAAANAAAAEKPPLRQMQQAIDALCASGAAAGDTVRIDELRKSVLNLLRAIVPPNAAARWRATPSPD